MTFDCLAFINECSLEGQFSDQLSFERAVTRFNELVDTYQRKVRSTLYKSCMLYNHEAIKKSPFKKSLNNIRDRSVYGRFLEIVFDKTNPKDWQEERKHTTNDSYFYGESNVVDTSVAELAERWQGRRHIRCCSISPILPTMGSTRLSLLRIVVKKSS